MTADQTDTFSVSGFEPPWSPPVFSEPPHATGKRKIAMETDSIPLPFVFEGPKVRGTVSHTVLGLFLAVTTTLAVLGKAVDG